MIKKVYICAPHGAEQLDKIKQYTAYALNCGAAPVVPQFYALCLRAEEPKSKKMQFTACMSLLWFCDELWVFGKEMTEPMRREIQFCKNVNIPIRAVKDSTVQKVVGGKQL